MASTGESIVGVSIALCVLESGESGGVFICHTDSNVSISFQYRC